MSGYRIIVSRANKLLRERFYVTCIAVNGEPIWHTEMFRDKDHAIKTGQEWTGYCDGNFIDETGG